MLRRLLVFSFVVWGILAVPALCRAGMLEHACACEAPSNCAHEEACSDDPCGVAKPATDGKLAAAPTVAAAPVALTPAPAALAAWIASPLMSVTADADVLIALSLRSGARPLRN